MLRDNLIIYSIFVKNYQVLNNGVREKMTDENIYLFNAYGRILNVENRIKNKKKISEKLKKIVKIKASDNNIEFNIKPYYENFGEKQEMAYLDKFNANMTTFVNNMTSINKLIESYNNLTDLYKQYMISHYLEEYDDYKYFQFISEILKLYPKFYECDMNDLLQWGSLKDSIAKFFFHYYVKILNNFDLHITKNLFVTLDIESCWKKISEYFKDVSEKDQYKIMNAQVLFADVLFKQNSDNYVKFIKSCFISTGGFEKYQFKQNFNEFILNCHRYFKFFHKVIALHEPFIINIPKSQTNTIILYRHHCDCGSVVNGENECIQNKFWYSKNKILNKCKSCNTNINIVEEKYEKINHIKTLFEIELFLDMLMKQINDPLYILHNKLEIRNFVFSFH